MEQPKKIIRIIAFQGIGTRYPQYANENPLIWYGHVGIQFEGDAIIYGFHPTEQAIDDAGGLDAFQALMEAREPVSGIFQDDTEIFKRAYGLFPTRPQLEGTDRNRLIVYVIEYEYDSGRFAAIYNLLREWYNQKKEAPYLFAPITETDAFDNCATIQRRLGMSILRFDVHKGRMGRYIPFLDEYGERWRPNDEEKLP